MRRVIPIGLAGAMAGALAGCAADLPRPGDVVTVTVTHGAPFHLLADDPTGAPLRIRRTR